MSILIKGVDLPKEGEDITLEINHKGEVRAYSTKLKEVDTDLQATQIPTPHGRLIDADVIKNELGVSDEDIYVSEILADAPTIIKAEE